VPQVIYEERAVEVPQILIVEAITKKPQPVVQGVRKEIPKYILQAQERIVEGAPSILKVERPVEIPQIMTAEAITQVPVAQVEIVGKNIPKVTTEVVTQLVEVPHVLVEEVLVEIPQIQTCEIIRQVQMPVIQTVQRQVARVTTQVVEVVQQVPAVLINEIAVDAPVVQVVEVMKQTCVGSAMRIGTTTTQFERAIAREEVVMAVSERVQTGIMYEAAPLGFGTVTMQPTVVERTNPMTITQVMMAGQGGVVASQIGVVGEIDQVNAYGQVVERDFVAQSVLEVDRVNAFGQVVEVDLVAQTEIVEVNAFGQVVEQEFVSCVTCGVGVACVCLVQPVVTYVA